ncbi:transcriptional regulator [Mycobacterium xenopi RIVM700367]|nr:transcriptional regulator [Mycobacterium xenopi RIVM700367]
MLTASRLLVAISAHSIAQVDEAITIPAVSDAGDLVEPRFRLTPPPWPVC